MIDNNLYVKVSTMSPSNEIIGSSAKVQTLNVLNMNQLFPSLTL